LKYARRDEKKNHLFQYHVAKLIAKLCSSWKYH
jgi:hypothetical protein